MTKKRFTAAGAGFTKRIITSPDGDIAEDRNATAMGSYTATAPLNVSGRLADADRHVPRGRAVERRTHASSFLLVTPRSVIAGD